MTSLAISVVIYNPTPEQASNLQRLSELSVGDLIVADNSEPSSHLYVGTEKISMNGNKGIGAALNACAATALSKGYDWLLTLDQDTELDEATLNHYIREFEAFPDKIDAAIIAPVLDDRIMSEESPGKVTDLDIVMTSCNLLNLRIWKEIGGFDEDLFIDEVDHDYCLKAKLNGYRIIRLENVQIRHYPGKIVVLNTRHGAQPTSWHPPRRLYYMARNFWHLKRNYQKAFPQVIAERKRLLFGAFYAYTRYHPNKIASIRALIKGVLHGWIGRYGR